MGNRRSLEQTTHRYDRLARVYNVLEPLYLIHDGARRKAVQALDLSPGDTVLEIGCGTGRTSGCSKKTQRLSVEDDVTGVLFSLSYSVLPERRPALEAAWRRLRAGGRLVW